MHAYRNRQELFSHEQCDPAYPVQREDPLLDLLLLDENAKVVGNDSGGEDDEVSGHERTLREGNAEGDPDVSCMHVILEAGGCGEDSREVLGHIERFSQDKESAHDGQPRFGEHLRPPEQEVADDQRAENGAIGAAVIYRVQYREMRERKAKALR